MSHEIAHAHFQNHILYKAVGRCENPGEVPSSIPAKIWVGYVLLNLPPFLALVSDDPFFWTFLDVCGRCKIVNAYNYLLSQTERFLPISRNLFFNTAFSSQRGERVADLEPGNPNKQK